MPEGDHAETRQPTIRPNGYQPMKALNRSADDPTAPHPGAERLDHCAGVDVAYRTG
jgi:hypothetical protein